MSRVAFAQAPPSPEACAEPHSSASVRARSNLRDKPDRPGARLGPPVLGTQCRLPDLSGDAVLGPPRLAYRSRALEKNTPCDCVVVRAKIEVDPITAALTVTTDNSGPYSIPTILGGISLQIKHVNVMITRPGFTYVWRDSGDSSVS
jgi:hypothetical protein